MNSYRFIDDIHVDPKDSFSSLQEQKRQPNSSSTPALTFKAPVLLPLFYKESGMNRKVIWKKTTSIHHPLF